MSHGLIDEQAAAILGSRSTAGATTGCGSTCAEVVDVGGSVTGGLLSGR